MSSGRRRDVARLVLGCVTMAAGGCGLRTIGPAERCAEIMRQADPADIDIVRRESEAQGIDTIIARVAGKRTDLPPSSSLPADLAVECRFDAGVMTGFRWTTGPGG